MGSQQRFTDSFAEYVMATCTSLHVRMRITTIVIYFAGHKFRVTLGRAGHRINNQPEVRLRVGAFDVGVLAHVASRILSLPSIRHLASSR